MYIQRRHDVDPLTGVDGTQLWLLPNLEEILAPAGRGSRGATTAVIWIKREDEPDDILVYGTQSGHLVVWKEMKRPEKVSSCVR